MDQSNFSHVGSIRSQLSKRVFRPSIGSLTLSVMTTLYVLVFLNYSFWNKGFEYYSEHPLAFAVFGVGVILVVNSIFLSFSFRRTTKPAFIFFIMVAAISSYFMDTFGVIITGDMIRNVVSTTVNEARHLITWKFILHVFAFGVVPSILIGWVKVNHRNLIPKLIHNIIVIFVSLILAVGAVSFDYPLNASVIRNQRDFLGSLNPVAPVAGAVKYTQNTLEERNIVVAPLGEDAEKGPLISGSSRPVVTIIVVGETARAQNFSLTGYERETNPELAQRNVVSFTDATSCGTSTAVSMPCMFSVFGRAQYTNAKNLSSENLLDVLSRAGVNVVWWDNNSGDKRVAARIPNENFAAGDTVPFCRQGECDDGILVDQLKQYIGGITKDTVIVMHQIGAHGPAYYLRYPPEFERFTPACNTRQLGDCTPEEIVNVYDNTILYTDSVLAQIIDVLKEQEDRFVTSMIYASDHGESLGELGLYLHGLPFILAPDVQIKVPFIVWLSPEFSETMKIDTSCLQGRRSDPISHDNLFHSVLGGMDISTEVYQPDLDIFAGCRS